jgi:uncharacterized MAPEG superfamily protein
LSALSKKQSKGIKIVVAYPFAILAVALLINLLVLDIETLEAALPTSSHLWAFIISGILLAINHSWLMTATEVTRIKYKMYATPEEWSASGTSWEDVPEVAKQELERNHNAHRNTTENTCYFLLLAIPFLLISPPIMTTQVWLIGFGLSRLGYTFSYLMGKDNLRGLFMSLSLVAMYGIASYLVISGIST